MGLSIIADFETLRCLLVANLNGTFAPVINSSAAHVVNPPQGGFLAPIRALKVNNDTDNAIWVSILPNWQTPYTPTGALPAGTTTKDYMPARSAFVWDIATNRSNSGGDFNEPKNWVVWVATQNGGAAAGTGIGVFVTAMYGIGD